MDADFFAVDRPQHRRQPALGEVSDPPHAFETGEEAGVGVGAAAESKEEFHCGGRVAEVGQARHQKRGRCEVQHDVQRGAVAGVVFAAASCSIAAASSASAAAFDTAATTAATAASTTLVGIFRKSSLVGPGCFGGVVQRNYAVDDEERGDLGVLRRLPALLPQL